MESLNLNSNLNSNRHSSASSARYQEGEASQLYPSSDNAPPPADAPYPSSALARLERAAVAYQRAGFRIAAQTATSLTLVRRTQGSGGVRGAALLLGLMFPPLLLFYLVGRSAQRDEVAYLRVASTGDIVEEGDTLEAINRELRRTRRTALAMLGVCLALAAGLIGYARWTAASRVNTNAATIAGQGSDAARSAAARPTRTPRASRSPRPLAAPPPDVPVRVPAFGVSETASPDASSTPTLAGGGERLPILKAVRASVERQIGESVKLYDVRLESDGEWAAVSATVKDETGMEVPLPDADLGAMELSSRVVAVLQKQGTTWRVRATSAATDDPTPDLMSRLPNVPAGVATMLDAVTAPGVVP